MVRVPASVVADAKRRAKLLETFEMNDGQMTKKRKLGEEEGDEEEDGFASRFLDRFKKLPWKTFQTNEEKQKAVQAIVEEYKTTKSSVVAVATQWLLLLG